MAFDIRSVFTKRAWPDKPKGESKPMLGDKPTGNKPESNIQSMTEASGQLGKAKPLSAGKWVTDIDKQEGRRQLPGQPGGIGKGNPPGQVKGYSGGDAVMGPRRADNRDSYPEFTDQKAMNEAEQGIIGKAMSGNLGAIGKGGAGPSPIQGPPKDLAGPGPGLMGPPKDLAGPGPGLGKGAPGGAPGAGGGPGFFDNLYNQVGPWGAAGLGAGGAAGLYGLYHLLANRRKSRDETEKESAAKNLGTSLGDYAALRAYGYVS